MDKQKQLRDKLNTEIRQYFFGQYSKNKKLYWQFYPQLGEQLYWQIYEQHVGKIDAEIKDDMMSKQDEMEGRLNLFSGQLKWKFNDQFEESLDDEIYWGSIGVLRIQLIEDLCEHIAEELYE